MYEGHINLQIQKNPFSLSQDYFLMKWTFQCLQMNCEFEMNLKLEQFRVRMNEIAVVYPKNKNNL